MRRSGALSREIRQSRAGKGLLRSKPTAPLLSAKRLALSEGSQGLVVLTLLVHVGAFR